MNDSREIQLRARFAVTMFYCIVAALEIWGYRAALAGQKSLGAPLWWKYGTGVLTSLVCWAAFTRERKKSGFGVSLGRAALDGVGIAAAVRAILRMFVGPGILDPPSFEFLIVCTILVAAVVALCFFRRQSATGIQFDTGDRIAAALFALLLLTRIGMVVATAHQRLILKGTGCVAVSIGALFMILGLLNADSSEQPDFSVSLASFATNGGEDHPIS
jgi:hypothetical protein